MPIAMLVLQLTLAFLLTGVLANWLVQKWQHRNWLRQQHFLGQEKDYTALKALFDEIVRLSGKRLSRMHRLAVILAQSDDALMQERLKQYSDVTAEWNENLNSFYVRLTMHADYSMTQRLEKSVHAEFVKVGRELEVLVDKRRHGSTINTRDINRVVASLDTVSGRLFSFNRDMLGLVQSLQRKVYVGIEIKFSESTLDFFPTWELFKALFVSRIKLHSIVRSSVDVDMPSRSWN
ncbi:hypothetical protein [Agrobacterium cavarae]